MENLGVEKPEVLIKEEDQQKASRIDWMEISSPEEIVVAKTIQVALNGKEDIAKAQAKIDRLRGKNKDR